MLKTKKAEAWAEAKKRCRLNEADIQMAKELGMTPKSLIKNIPTRDQKWKAPVKVWISDLYEEKFGKVLTDESVLSKGTNGKKKKQEKPMTSESLNDEDYHFEKYTEIIRTGNKNNTESC